MDMNKIAPLFYGWEETLIWSCLQSCMGYAIANDEQNPTSAQITVGDFCFLAGEPNTALVEKATAPIIIPQNEGWEKTIENVLGARVKRDLRYAIKKEGNIFDSELLNTLINSLNRRYNIKMFDKELYRQAMGEEWSKDFCSQFKDAEDFERRGLGVAILYNGKLVAGASSYTVYNGGIEIEIDTEPKYRKKGLAKACGARLILECLSRGLYPSWDAHDLRSVALAEKLGYHFDKPYTVYLML